MLYSIICAVSLPLCKIIFRLKVYGKKYIPKKGGFILASNHLSYLDPFIIGIVCPRKLNFMARHDLFFIPFFGKLLSTLGVFPVKRGAADISAIREAIRRVRRGNALVLFPEGRRRRVDNVNTDEAPEAGIGFLAAKLDVPVIPAFIKGTEKAMPIGAKFIYPKKISVSFGEGIYVDKGLSYQEIAQTIMERIRHLGS